MCKHTYTHRRDYNTCAEEINQLAARVSPTESLHIVDRSFILDKSILCGSYMAGNFDFSYRTIVPEVRDEMETGNSQLGKHL